MKNIPEFSIEGGVDDRVDGTVDVAKPRYHRDEGGSDVTGLAQHFGDMNNKERRPTSQKHT